MNSHHKVITEVTFYIILGTAITIAASHAKGHSFGQNVHRAYEPASILLDINLQRDTLRPVPIHFPRGGKHYHKAATSFSGPVSERIHATGQAPRRRRLQANAKAVSC